MEFLEHGHIFRRCSLCRCTMIVHEVRAGFANLRLDQNSLFLPDFGVVSIASSPTATHSKKTVQIRFSGSSERCPWWLCRSIPVWIFPIEQHRRVRLQALKPRPMRRWVREPTRTESIGQTHWQELRRQLGGWHCSQMDASTNGRIPPKAMPSD